MMTSHFQGFLGTDLVRGSRTPPDPKRARTISVLLVTQTRILSSVDLLVSCFFSFLFFSFFFLFLILSFYHFMILIL